MSFSTAHPMRVSGKITGILDNIHEISHYHDIRISTSGADTFVDVNIHVQPDLNIQQAHEISHQAEKEICRYSKMHGVYPY